MNAPGYAKRKLELMVLHGRRGFLGGVETITLARHDVEALRWGRRKLGPYVENGTDGAITQTARPVEQIGGIK